MTLLETELSAARAEIAELRAKLAAAEKDAERYRYWRSVIGAETDKRGRQWFNYPDMNDSRNNLIGGSVAGHFDLAIDAAIAGSAK